MRTFKTVQILLLGSLLMMGSGCDFEVEPITTDNVTGNIGLEIDIINGLHKGIPQVPLLLLGKKKNTFYINQIRFQVKQTDFPATDALDWMEQHSEMSTQAWTGINNVHTAWAQQADGTYWEERAYLGAGWMREAHAFTLRFVDKSGKTVGQPIELSESDFVIVRKVAQAWGVGQKVKGDDGSNQGDYTGLTIKTGGTCGSDADVYKVEVVKEGILDNFDPTQQAEVRITSLFTNPYAPPPAPVALEDNTAVSLGQGGPTITFDDDQLPVGSGAKAVLKEGDRWIVRCPTPNKPPKAAEAGIHTSWNAVAEVRLSLARFAAENFTLPETTAKLEITWSKNKTKPYVIPIVFVPIPTMDYGLQIKIFVDPPKNGRFYLPGQKVTGHFELEDNAGNALFDKPKDYNPPKVPGTFPTYKEFWDAMTGQRKKELPPYNGVLYFRPPSLPGGHGYFDEYRLNITEVALSGPKQWIKSDYNAGDPTDYFLTAHEIPETGVIFGGFGDPKLWDLPLHNTFEFELPKRAKKGTYVLMVKAQRSFLGEVIYKLDEVELKVGTEETTYYNTQVGNCDVCHTHDAALGRMRHGTDDDRNCVICHQRPFGLAGEMLHAIHFFAESYTLPKNDCTLCHLEPGTNIRASIAMCSQCHQSIHEGEHMNFEHLDPYDHCAPACHNQEPAGHVHIPTQ